ncbi:uncharacterized protein LOC125848627 [Solanum stenotomum]|uniref:uncharacterized protein LOC125848627 n=1 Tax=Solanum stenotomum TaxID=172797 RepID=UPI0020D1E61C|nr:uncharacterized protein LOC125848627 [Solanum stenotomum]
MSRKELARDMHRLARLGVRLVDSDKGGVMVCNGSESSFVNDVKAKQCIDLTLVELKEAVLKKSVEAFFQGGDGVLRYHSRLCVPNVDELRKQILAEAHSSWWCRSPIVWSEVGEIALFGPELVHEAMEKVGLIRER